MKRPSFKITIPVKQQCFAVFALLGGAFAGSPSHAQPSPQPDVTVAYDVSTFGGTATRMDDDSFSISHGDGGVGIFSIRLRRSTGGAGTAAMVRTPLGYDNYQLNAAEVHSVEQEYGSDEEVRATVEYERLLRALRHHRPEVPIGLNTGETTRPHQGAPLVEFDRCGRALLELSINTALAAEAEGNDRDHWRNRRTRLGSLLRPQLREASILLGLISVPLTRADGGYWTQFSRRQQAERRDDRVSQFDWRNEQTLTHGQEFRTEVDIRPGSRTPFGRACRNLRPPRLRNTISDVCTLAIVFDRRDGWPIAASFNRIRTAPDRSTSNAGMIYWRVRALEGFVPPPNPCPAA